MGVIFKVSGVLLAVGLFGLALLLGFAALIFSGSAGSSGMAWSLLVSAIVCFVLGIGVGVLVVLSFVRASRRASALALQFEGEPVVTWQAGERLACSHMRTLGFTDAVVTRGGADNGLDVMSQHAVAQVKHHGQPIGRPDLQRLRGATHQGKAMLFYSRSGYTNIAVQFASQVQMALFSYTPDRIVRPVGTVAARMMQELRLNAERSAPQR